MQQSEAQLREQALQRQLQMLGLASGPAFVSPGQSYKQTSTGTGSGQSFGNALGGAIGGAGGDISSWLILQQLLKKANTGGTSPGFGTAPGLGSVPDPNANFYGSN